MELKAAETLAKALMAKHGLTEWEFMWTRGKRTFGVCHTSKKGKFIKLSKILVGLNEEWKVKDTILHEIAHALVGHKHGHDKVWKAKCVEIGAIPEMYYDCKDVIQPDLRYVAICGACQKKHTRGRTPKYSQVACGCQRNKPWSAKILLVFKDSKTNAICIPPPVAKVMYTVFENGQIKSFTCDSELIEFVKRHVRENGVQGYDVSGISDATEYLELCADNGQLTYREN